MGCGFLFYVYFFNLLVVVGGDSGYGQQRRERDGGNRCV